MKPILVTGAAKGLGSAICRSLAAKGHDIVIHYNHSEKEAHKVAKECRTYNVDVAVLQGDFSTKEGVDAFTGSYLASYSQTKGLVNNVGNYLIAPSLATTFDQWTDLFQTNFFAPLFLTQALLPSIKNLKGSLVNIGVNSLHGERAMTKATAYAATKSTLFFYTRALAKELAPEGVRVNMVSPGYMENSVDLKEVGPLPMKRPAYLYEVAEIVAAFFEPLSAYITGQNIEVAGGVGL